MSKIKAITSTNSDMDRDRALDELFNKMVEEAEVDIDLPSKGRFYADLERVTIKPLTYEEEERILRANNSGATAINLLLKNCVEGVSIPDLLQMDKLYLLLKVREVSYGAEYKFSVACPHCDTSVSTEINLSTGLNIARVDGDLEDPRTVKLPKLGVDVVVRFPRVRDEAFLGSSEETVKNLYRFVDTLDGNSDTVFISKALKRLHIVDVKTVLKEVVRGEYGVDSRFVLECPHCKKDSTMSIPLDVDFFSVS